MTGPLRIDGARGEGGGQISPTMTPARRWTSIWATKFWRRWPSSQRRWAGLDANEESPNRAVQEGFKGV